MIQWLENKDVLRIVVMISLGILLGLGGFTVYYAEGTSYLSSDPIACTNCHIMQPQYNSWQKSSHHNVANCVNCHLPSSFFAKYIAKAKNGFHHSKAFTFQNFHEPIMIKEKNARILHKNCIRCHKPLVHGQISNDIKKQVKCVHCHSDVGHGETTGLGRNTDR